ncbi:hypothetical protein BKA93DRAFT_779147 [Sparassis latifolia]
MASEGSKQDMNKSRAQALQALLHSMSPEGSSSSGNGKNLTTEQVRKISDKLGEILGDEELGADGGQRRNEKGELVNEEGLPIIDIREPMADASSPIASAISPEHIFDDPDLLPPWALSPAEKARRRAERERILDLLEEEEHAEQERDEAANRERWLAELERRKEAAKAEMDSLKKARDLQKKMGRALLRNVTETREREEKERAEREKEEREEREKRLKVKPKKSVSFAEPPVSEEDEVGKSETRSGWGSVALGRLERKGKSPLMTKAEMDKQPMRMHVVERHPGAMGASQSQALSDNQDSDDESVPGPPVLADSDEGDVINSDHSEDHEDHPSAHSDSEDTEAEPNAEDEPVVWDEEELDYARHQREIALAYYEKRATITSDVASAMRAHTHDEAENDWDQPEVPLDATLASAPPKSSISRFKAEHSSGTSSSSLASHSLGPSVLPSSQSSSLNRAVRMGKLVNGQLTGGEPGDSGDDGEMEAREILELLSRGQVKNVGPEANSTLPQVGNSVIAGPSNTQHRAPVSPALETTADADGASAPPKSKPSKVSKFKLALSQTQWRSPGAVSPTVSPSTPSTIVERSSPKLVSPPLLTPIATPPIPSSPGRVSIPSGAREHNTVLSAVQQGQMPSMIVESPSLPTSQVVIDSPSFQTSSSHQVLSPKGPAANRSPPGTSVISEHPASMMAAEVRESTSTPLPGDELRKERKISRFLAERS